MVLRTGRLVLRPVTMEDLQTMHDYAGNTENTKYMMFLPYASIGETAEVLQKSVGEWEKDEPGKYDFAICLNGRHIGGITLYMEEDRTQAELGWVLHRDFWRQGFVSEAAQALVEFARSIGVRRIFACCDSENIGSYRTMEKLGMRLIQSDGVRTNRSMGEEKRIELVYEMLLSPIA